MGRTLLAVLLGAVVHFLWGWASHMFIGWYEPVMANVPNEAAFMSGLGSMTAKEKVYMFPAHPAEGSSAEDMKAYQEKVAGGASGVVMVSVGGMEPMGPQQMANGFLLEVISTVMVVFILVVT